MARYDNGDNQKLVRRKRKKHNFKKDLSTEHILKKIERRYDYDTQKTA